MYFVVSSFNSNLYEITIYWSWSKLNITFLENVDNKISIVFNYSYADNLVTHF